MAVAPVIDVVIVGGGPVGTLLSAELARAGIAAETLERRTEIGASSRAVGVHAAALAAMEASGATERLLAGARRVRVGEARRRGRMLGEVRFDRLPSRHPYVATLPQPATEAALAATATSWGAAEPRRGNAVTALRDHGDAVEVQVDGGSPLSARVVVVAGGLRARTLLPVAERRRPSPDRYLMTDAADAGRDGDRAVVHLDPAGVLESFPLPGGRRRYVAWMPPGHPRAPEAASDLERLRAAVAERTGSDAEASAVRAATAFGIARSRLERFRAGRLLAIGDTAHEVSPIGGQGMNLGLIDAVTLAPLLAQWLRENGVPAALAAWERERLRAADRAARIAGLNTALGRARGPVAAAAVQWALHTPVEGLMARAYSMQFDPAARLFPPAS